MKQLILLLFLFVSFNQFCQQLQFGEIDPDRISDGPYIFWQEDQAEILYLVNSKPVKLKIEITDLKNKELVLEEIGFKQRILENHTLPQVVFDDVEKYFAISDIHGQHDYFVQILQNNEIIDQNLDWNWQNGHLVILGDVFDRGPHVTGSLWLIYKLEQQAAEAGGYVHFLLGNHELMIFRNDLRYLHEKYNFVAEQLNISYTELYSSKTELGSWLRFKPTVIRLNDHLFVHAGISPLLAEAVISLQNINTAMRDYLSSRHSQTYAQEFLDLLLHSNGPFWYRGYFQDSKRYKMIHEAQLDSILRQFQAAKIFVGHTTQDSILSVWNGKVIAVDSGIKYGDKGEGLLWQDDIFYRASHSGKKIKLDFIN